MLTSFHPKPRSNHTSSQQAQVVRLGALSLRYPENGGLPSEVKVIETFKGWSGRFVFLSSCDVYRAHAVLNRTTNEPVQKAPLQEDSPLRTNSFPYRGLAAGPDDWRYNYDKIPIERMLLEEPALRTTVLRLPAVYGPHDYQLRVWEYLREMDAQRKAIILSESLSKWRWSRGYVENIAAAVSHVLRYEPAPLGIFNLTDPIVLNEKEWIQQIAQTAGWDGPILIMPDDRLLAHRLNTPHWPTRSST